MTRVYDFMTGAMSAKPSAVEIDGASESGRAHTRICYGQDAAARNSPDGKLALIHIRPLAQMAHYSIQILNSPLEARKRNFDIAGIAGPVWSKSLSITSA